MFTNKCYKSNVITLSLLMQIFVSTKLPLQVYYDQLQWQCLIVSTVLSTMYTSCNSSEQ